MEENNTSAILSDLSETEERFKRWKKAYQQHLGLMEQFYRWQEGHNFKLAQYEEKRQMFRDMQEALLRFRQQLAYRRAITLHTNK